MQERSIQHRLQGVSHETDVHWIYYGSVCVCSGRDGVWIELTYTGGDNYTSHCDKRARMTRLAFLCDPNINGKVCFYDLLG